MIRGFFSTDMVMLRVAWKTACCPVEESDVYSPFEREMKVGLYFHGYKYGKSTLIKMEGVIRAG